MTTTADATTLADLWDDARAAGLSEPELLRYRSNLLGSDKRITNFGGGNTSAKVRQTDPLSGAPVEVLWVKGSGGDVGSIGLDGFATLYMEKLRGLQALYRGVAHEDEMVGLLAHCTFGLNPRAASIDTPLHAFTPRRHVDHMHPDAIIAIAASADSQALTAEIFGDEIGWLPWKRPGFELGLWLERFCRDNPAAKGVVLESHGLFTWADDAQTCYRTTLDVINRATAWLGSRMAERPAFGGAARAAEPVADRQRVASALAPRLRGLISADAPKIGHFDDQQAVLEFINSETLPRLGPLGTSCPDHFLRTKIRPLLIEMAPSAVETEAAQTALNAAVQAYRADYAAYYERCKRPDSPAMRDPNAVVYLLPGIGMFTFAKDKPTARISAEFYVNAINVMRGASAVSTYRGLPEQEAFDIEYWLLEEAKLKRMPKPKPLSGRVALVTGGAGGIGSATAERLLADGACVILADIDTAAAAEAEAALAARFGADAVRAVGMDVTDEQAVARAFAEAAIAFGGIDILVSNAGIASAAPIEDTSLALWDRTHAILSTGYFLAAREGFRLMKAQGLGGSIVFVGSKNGLAASAGASAYCAAKASEIHLARCLALEGAAHGIRVNTVNPDAVLEGSRIWRGEWRSQRAAAYGVAEDDLDRVYRERSMLKRSVLPTDIAEAVAFFASDLSAKSTGNILNVDAGNATAFTR